MFTERAVRLGKPRKSFLHFLPHREVGLSTLPWLQTASGLSLGYPLDETLVDRAYLISPIVDMEKLICNMMQWSGVTEQELALTSIETVSAFAKQHHAGLTVMPGGEHWFHTEEQMQFLDHWIRECNAKNVCC